MTSNGQKQVRFEQQQAGMTEIQLTYPSSYGFERTTTTEILSVSHLPDIVATPPPILPQHQLCSFLLGERPQAAVCPHCKHMVRTVVRYLPGKMTFVMMLVICCAFFPLCWLPLCIDVCKDAHHFCPDCCHRIGVKKRY